MLLEATDRITHGDLVMLEPLTDLTSIHRVRRTYRGKVYTYCGLVRTKGKLTRINFWIQGIVNCRKCIRNDASAE